MQAQQYVGIDLHRRRSVIVRMDSDGKKLSCVRLPNDPIEIAEEMAKAGESPEVVIEATYGCTGWSTCSRATAVRRLRALRAPGRSPVPGAARPQPPAVGQNS